jgi:hypothetical protein
MVFLKLIEKSEPKKILVIDFQVIWKQNPRL